MGKGRKKNIGRKNECKKGILLPRGTVEDGPGERKNYKKKGRLRFTGAPAGLYLCDALSERRR